MSATEIRSLNGYKLTDETARGNIEKLRTESQQYTNTKISQLINSAPTTLDTLGEIAAAMAENATVVEALDAAIGQKADKSDIPSLDGLATEEYVAEAIASVPKGEPDWNAKEGEEGYIKNRTHWINNDYQEIQIETEERYSEEFAYGEDIFTLPIPKVGVPCKIKFNDEEYECIPYTIQSHQHNYNSQIFMGSIGFLSLLDGYNEPTYDNGQFNNYPFLIRFMLSPSSEYSNYISLFSNNSGIYTIGFYGTDIQKIEDKFLPQYSGSFVGIKTLGNNETFNSGAHIARGYNNHAEGHLNVVHGQNSHVEGYNNQTYGYYNHIEGVGNNNSYKLDTTGTHVEGCGNTAYGAYSHVEGYFNSGYDSEAHVSGMYNDSDGMCSTVIGAYNLPSRERKNERYAIPEDSSIKTFTPSTYPCYISKYDASPLETFHPFYGYCFVQYESLTYNDLIVGDYFTEDLNQNPFDRSYYTKKLYHVTAIEPGVSITTDEYILEDKWDHKDNLFVVGNGDSNSGSSNAHTLDWNGNAWYSGDVYVGSTSGTNRDEGSKKLATEEYVSTMTSVRNLLDNSDFEIEGTGNYLAARWEKTGNLVFTKTGNVKKIASTSEYNYTAQRLWSDGQDKGKTYTAVVTLADGRKIVGSGSFPAEDVTAQTIAVYIIFDKGALTLIKDPNQQVIFRIDAIETDAEVEFLSVDLFEGAYTVETVPPHVPKGYANELLACEVAKNGDVFGYLRQQIANYRTAVNLLDNSDFRNPVNQRGQESYTKGGYTIDRWLTTSGSHHVFVQSDGLKVVGMFRQYCSSVNEGKTYTIAAKNADGNLYVYSGVYGSGTIGNGSDLSLSKSSSTGHATFQIIGRDTAWEWAALYEGTYTAETLPPYVPKGYAAELAECRRYYREMKYLRVQPYNVSSSVRYYRINIDPPMRENVIPTITLVDTEETPLNSWTGTGATFAVSAPSNNSFTVSATSNNSASNFRLAVDVKISSDL